MTSAVVLLAIALFLAVSLCLRLEQSIRRERIQATERFDHLADAALHDGERAAEERKELYQRIQAPSIAVAEAHRERVGEYTPRRPIGADDDAAFAARDKKAGEDG
jgi:hypothetical protein